MDQGLTSNLPRVLGHIAGALLVLALMSAITALFLKWATRIAARFSIPYWRAYLIVFTIWGLFCLVDQLLVFTLGHDIMTTYSLAILIPLAFLIGCPCIISMVRHPVRGSIGIGKGLGISCIYLFMHGLFIGLIVVLANRLLE